MLRKSSVLNEKLLKVFKLFFVRHIAKEKKICNLFKTKTVILKNTVNDILYIIAPVTKLTLARNKLSVNKLILCDCRNICKTCENTLTVKVTQTSFYIVLAV